MYFDELDLNDNVLDALYDMRFDTCTPVQEKCIPEILEGHDVLGVGLALSFGYIMLQTVSATFAIQANFPPVLAAWLPNFLFAIVAYFCYRKAPR